MLVAWTALSVIALGGWNVAKLVVQRRSNLDAPDAPIVLIEEVGNPVVLPGTPVLTPSN